MSWRTRIASTPSICHGEPRFKNTRILVSSVLGTLAAGYSSSDVLADWPQLEPEDISVALDFASDLARRGGR